MLFSQLREKGDYTQSHALDTAVYMTTFRRFLELPVDDIPLLGYLGSCRTWASFTYRARSSPSASA